MLAKYSTNKYFRKTPTISLIRENRVIYILANRKMIIKMDNFLNLSSTIYIYMSIFWRRYSFKKKRLGPRKYVNQMSFGIYKISSYKMYKFVRKTSDLI